MTDLLKIAIGRHDRLMTQAERLRQEANELENFIRIGKLLEEEDLARDQRRCDNAFDPSDDEVDDKRGNANVQSFEPKSVASA